MTNRSLALDALAETWAAVVPTEHPEVSYHEIDEDALMAGASADRGFFFETSARVPNGEAATGSAILIQWDVQAMVMIPIWSRGARALDDAKAAEANALCRAVESRSTWPAGATIETGEVSWAEDDSAEQHIICTIPLTIWVEET